MTKQEIREGLLAEIKYIIKAGDDKTKIAEAECITDQIRNYLHSQGVVIKDRCYGMGMDTRGGYNWKDIFFVIPLIEEVENGDNEVP